MTERYGHLSDAAVFTEAGSLFVEKRPVQAGTVAGTGSELVSSKTS